MGEPVHLPAYYSGIRCHATATIFAMLFVSVLPVFVLAAPKQSSQLSPDELAPLEKSVQPFYTVTEQFLDFIQPVENSYVMPEVVSSLLNGSYFKGKLDWKQTSRRYALGMLGYAILISLGVLFIVGLILSGCIIFCCRCCCGKCGGRLRPMERKRAKCRRVVYGILLTVFATLMLCGLVLAFISNQLAHNALDNARPGSAPRQFASGLSGAASELEAVPRRARNASAQVVSATVANLSSVAQSSFVAMATALLEKSGLANQLSDAKRTLASLAEVKELSNRLTGASWTEAARAWDSLNDTLASLRSALATPGNCPAASAACDWLLANRDRLEVSQPSPSWERSRGQCRGDLPAELTNPRLNATHGEISSFLNRQPNGFALVAMDAVKKQLDSAKSELNSSAKLDKIWLAAETAAANASAYLRQAANSVNAMIINPTNNAEQSVAAVLTAFDLYRYYLCIGLACLALLIVAFYYLGLAFGFCGEPPYEDSRCCNKGVGANLLLTGTGFAFIFGWLIMIFVMAFFVTGAVLDTEVCRHLTGRAGAPGYQAMDLAAEELLRGGNISRYTSRRLFTGLFGDCADAAAANRPASFAAVLNLSELVRTSFLQQRTGQLADQYAAELRNRWPDIARQGFTQPDQLDDIVGPLKAAVDKAGGNETGPAAAACAAALNRGPLNFGLDATRLLDSVKQVADSLAADPATRTRWSDLARRLSADIDAAVASVADKRVASVGLTGALADVQNYGRNITDRLKSSLTSVANDNSHILNASLLIARQNLTSGLDSLLRDALTDALNSAADCAALGANLRLAVQAPCVQLLRPLNGYWAGLGLFLVCLLFAVPLACKLANLYRKTSKYQKDYQEPDYMAYQGFYPSDTVPLDGQGKPKRRKPSGSRDKSRASQQLSSGVYQRDSAAGASGVGAGAGAVNRQSQRYSQLPPYAQEAYDY